MFYDSSELEEHYYLSLISPNFRRLTPSAAISQAIGENLTLTVGGHRDCARRCDQSTETPRPDPYAFTQEVLRIDMENFVHHSANPGPVFFERGVLDALCGLDHIRPLNESELNMWLSKYQYFRKVFVLPPWKAIYENDAERDHTFEHAELVDRIAQEWYRRCGYRVLEVPMVSVDERCTFVLQALADGEA